MSLSRGATTEMQMLVKSLKIDPDNVKVFSPSSQKEQGHKDDQNQKENKEHNKEENNKEKKKMKQVEITSMMNGSKKESVLKASVAVTSKTVKPPTRASKRRSSTEVTSTTKTPNTPKIIKRKLQFE